MNRDLFSYEIAKTVQTPYRVDDDTFEIIKDSLDSANGKCVALTDAATVGFGVANDKLYGIIVKAEADQTATVRTGYFAEGTYLGEAPPAVGDIVKVDGAGGLVAASSQTNYGPTLIRIDEDGTGVLKF